jgi:CheY-like chemotaxis protein
VIEATHGLPALFRVVRTPPDLILADLHMPVVNGLELLEQLKNHEDTRNIPVVVVSGSATLQDRDRALEAGCALTSPSQLTSSSSPRRSPNSFRHGPNTGIGITPSGPHLWHHLEVASRDGLISARERIDSDVDPSDRQRVGRIRIRGATHGGGAIRVGINPE